MKQMILGLALVACAVACKNTSNKAVSDPNSANMPKAECGMKSECSGKAAADCSAKAECAGQKAACCAKDKPQG
jgi:hypothetical protein